MVDIDKEEVCVSCSNGFQTVNFDNLEIHFEQPTFRIPTKIFAIENIPYSLKTIDVTNISIKNLKKYSNLCTKFEFDSGILKLLSPIKGEFDLELNVISKGNEESNK